MYFIYRRQLYTPGFIFIITCYYTWFSALKTVENCLLLFQLAFLVTTTGSYAILKRFQNIFYFLPFSTFSLIFIIINAQYIKNSKTIIIFDMNQGDQIDESTAPNQFLCPIFQQIMKDPVITVDGFCFERRAIQEWFGKGKNTNPLTNKPLASKNLVQNRSLRNVIEHHNQRVRQIERQAQQNAQSFIKNANESLSQIFPQMINDAGFLDLDKLIRLATQNSILRKTLQKSSDNFNLITKRCDSKDTKNCQNCKSLLGEIKNYKSFIQTDVTSTIKAQSALKSNNISIQPDEIFCLLINNQMVKGIDFKRIKKADLKKFSIKAVLLKRLTIEQLINKIRLLRKIPEKDFIKLWITDMPTDKLYAHISQQAEVVTGPYLCKVKCVGRKVQNTKQKVNDLKMSPEQYLIVQHGPGEEFVFRDAEGKCDYCYRMRPINFYCDCKKAYYCCKQCFSKDQPYHLKVCMLHQSGSQKNII